MRRLSIEDWKNIIRNIEEGDKEVKEEFGECVEIIWLDDGSNEWVLAYGYEVFEDRFKTEKEATDRLNEIEMKIK